MAWNYERIKATLKETRAHGEPCTRDDLIALAPQNDPFYCGTPGEREKAEWFGELWARFGYGDGVHLRRVHYQLVSQEELVRRPDGTPYENTETDWAYLGTASKCARYLGTVDLGAFVDRRNPDPHVYTEYHKRTEPGYTIYDPTWGGIDLPSLGTMGYEGALQPYHVEVWVEKTTMDDVLLPLCRRYKANLVTGAGEMSITATCDLVQRVRTADRPCRVLYVSDFDPAGYGMPKSVARKVEWLIRERYPGLDIRLEPIALTRDQVIDYRLPRQPIKESERRKGAFEDVHGTGAVELDALEALRPGALADIVRAEILRYYDQGLENGANRQRWALQNALEELEAEALEELDPEIEAVKERIAGLRRAIRERLWDAMEEIDIDDYALPEPELPPEGNGVLFDSTREYLDQLAHYKARQNGAEVAT